MHRAVAHDGTLLACKLQYPDMQAAVEADLRQLKLAISVYERYDRAIRPRRSTPRSPTRLREELDYEREVKHMRLYRQMLAGETTCMCPSRSRRSRPSGS